MRYKWILFDADGTLFDYEKAESAALGRAFGEFGRTCGPVALESYRQINHQAWQAFERGELTQKRLRTERFERLFKALELQMDPVAFSKSYLQHLGEGTYLIAGAEEVVQRLVGQVGLMLITNGLSEVQRPRLAHSVLNGLFAGMVISEEVGSAKPDTRIFDVAFARMEHPRKEEVLLVGDSLTSDIQGANNYQIDACWFNPDHRPKDRDVQIEYEIDRLDALLDILTSA